MQLSKFYIRRLKEDDLKDGKDVCWASIICDYVKKISQDVPNLPRPSDALFFTGRNKAGTKFSKTPIGKNLLSEVGKEVANVLSKPDPSSYTGHCWRRSSASAAADNGATTMDLRTHYNWANDTMCKVSLKRAS